MNKDKMKEIINKIETISNQYENNEFETAIYIFLRLGKHEFDNYIDCEDLQEISEAILNQNTLFNEDLNDFVSSIL